MLILPRLFRAVFAPSSQTAFTHPSGEYYFDKCSPLPARIATAQYSWWRIRARYGKAERIWVMDRGMTSEENIAYLREGGRRYILGTPKSELKNFERQLVDGNWMDIREGLEVKLCPSADDQETFISCRSAKRQEKRKGHARAFRAPDRIGPDEDGADVQEEATEARFDRAEDWQAP